MNYREFLQSKVELAAESGFEIDRDKLNPALMEHQKDAVQWALRGGRRALFESYGLGKTVQEIEFCYQAVKRDGGKAMIVCPLGVRQEFTRDAERILGYDPPEYVRTMEEVKAAKTDIVITNYERVRDGDIDPKYFTATSLDEASVLRSFGSKTYQTFLDKFKGVPYKMVATATPSPNKYKELIHYAGYLEVMDTGQALAQPLDSNVLTPIGWKQMGDIVPGDYVIGRNGRQTVVTGIYPQGKKKIFRVVFSDGTSARCTGDHLWLTQTQYQRNACAKYVKRNGNVGTEKYWTVKTTDEIKTSLICESTGSKNHSIPMMSPAEFDSQDISIEPYVLGYLIGNGCFRETSVTVSTNDEWVVNRFRDLLKEFGVDIYKNTHERKDGQGNYDYYITNGNAGKEGRGHHSNRILNAIEQYGLKGKRSWEKFIPNEFLFNSISIREQLLQGLMDSDGTVDKNIGTPIYTTVSERLKDDFVSLVQSLGGVCNVSTAIGKKPNGEPGRLQYNISFRLPDGVMPFALPRKAKHYKSGGKRSPIRYITDVIEDGEEEAQCIMVEDPEHLYITDNFIVTHNTRFFKRDSTKANNLTLYPSQEEEFWMWMSSWALFITRPSDLNPLYSDEGYDLPDFEIRWHELPIEYGKAVDKDGQISLFVDGVAGLAEAAKVKRDSIDARVAEAKKIVDASPDDHFILWHSLESERAAIKKAIPEAVEIYGNLDMDLREKRTIDFSDGKYRILATKESISGSGCNFQRYCHREIFVGVDYKANDFMQSLHRVYRFLQTKKVIIDVIYMENEKEVKDALLRKWKNHDKMVAKMVDIVREYGLNDISRFKRLERKMGVETVKVEGKHYTAVNDDCVAETRRMKDNSIDLIHTSIPFGNHYEYSSNYCDFGHNEGNKEFFEQMDFLTPELYRVLKPGRVMAVHVKDRVLFGNATGTGMPTMDFFHALCIIHYVKHGFQYFGMITVVTDVVRENNQTYRLGYTEMCKDGTKMGVGCPEYVLLFRKLPTDTSTAYADTPVVKDKQDYSLSRWQVDAHAFWRSNGDRPLDPEEMSQMSMSSRMARFKEFSKTHVYDYHDHIKLSEGMEKHDAISKTFMTLAPASVSDDVWDDVVRMRTLNLEQAKRGEENHLCPLQYDIVERIIERYSSKGEVVFDPFAGIFTVPMMAIKMGRYGYGVELSETYFKQGVEYCNAAETDVESPSLFDFIDMEEGEGDGNLEGH